MMVVFVIATISICAITLIAANTTNRAINRQDLLLERYRLSYDLSGAVHELLYRGADLSNSLSDSALDAFLAAQTKLDHLSMELNEPDLTRYIHKTALEIASISMSALDHYISDDRKAGDAKMDTVRTLSASLQSRVLAHQSKRLMELEEIQKRNLSINSIAGSATIAFTFLAVLTTGTLMFLIYQVTISPIQGFITSLKDASSAPGEAKRFRAKSHSGGEIGEATIALNSLLDATENALEDARAQAEMAEQSEARWKAIFNLSPDAIILVDKETSTIVDCNPATIDMMGVAKEDFSKYSAYDFHTHEKEALRKFLADIHTNGHARADHLSCKLEDKIIPVSVVGVNVPGDNNDSTMLYVRDMSDIVTQQRNLEKAQQEAEQASNVKSAFLATMSHEIRTPLNGMMGMAQALESSALSPDDAEKVSTIVESGDMLMTLLNDVLDITKISAEQMQLSPTPANLEQLVTQTHKLFSAQAKDKNLDFIVTISPDLPEIADFDPVRVRQCLTNLISNALKFTQSGKVEIEAFVDQREETSCTLGLRVTDTGIGMSAETRDRIFSPFIQADSSISRQFGGTGLGLSISHELAKMMDGDIQVHSTPGEGSSFTFVFKAGLAKTQHAAADKRAPKPAKTGLSDRKALIVDDSAINRKVIRTLLSATGIGIAEAVNGQEALDKLHLESFDVILLDMHMPVLNGPDTIAYIRSCDEDWNDIPVLAVTADAAISDKKCYQAMGLDGYIAKPIDQRMLFTRIFEALGKARSGKGTARKTA